MLKTLFAAAAIAVAPFASAQAATLDAVELLQQFNLITTGDVQANSLHVHGRALIGGKMTGNLAEVNHDNIDNLVASDFDELILGERTSGTNVRVLNGGTVSTTGSGGYIDAASVSTPAVAPEDYAAILSEFSDNLALLSSTASADKTTFSNRISFDSAASGGTTVYDITAADLAGREVELLLNGADNIVINVTGSGTLNWNTNSIGDKSVSTNVIWNFVGFDQINITSTIWGQILADGSDVYFSTDLEGSLFAKNVTGQAQIHVQTLDYPNPQPVPLPATLPLILVGLGAFGVLRRREA